MSSPYLDPNDPKVQKMMAEIFVQLLDRLAQEAINEDEEEAALWLHSYADRERSRLEGMDVRLGYRITRPPRKQG